MRFAGLALLLLLSACAVAPGSSSAYRGPSDGDISRVGGGGGAGAGGM